LAEPGAVVLDEATRRLTGALFEWADLGTAELKGFRHPVRAWRALREGQVESRFVALRSGGAAPPLVGRDEELELLLRLWRRARAGEGQVVLLGGEAGIGKSRLVAALREALRGDGHERLDWFCAPQHRGSALHPVITRLERAAAFAPSDAPEAKLAKLRALLAPGDPTQEEVGLVADLLGLRAEGHGPGTDLDARQRRERTLAALLRRVQALAARRPVLGVFEDAHWADPTTIELLDLMVGRAAGLPLLLVVTHRPEFRAPWANQAQVAELRLDRLGPRDSAALVGRVAAAAGAGALPPEVVEGIVERTDGVPLFAEELTRAVLEAGYNGAGAQAVPAVPATLHASLAARLDRLGPAAKRAAQAGAAIGREFDQDLLAAAVDMPDHDLAPALRRLEDAGLVHRRGAPPGATYSFRHALLRDAAYGMLLRGQRRTLHARVAEALEELRPEAAEREPQVLAWHCANAGLTDRAVALWRRAGERSAARYANLEAAEHFRRALERSASWRRASGGTGSRPSSASRRRCRSSPPTASGRRPSRPLRCARRSSATASQAGPGRSSRAGSRGTRACCGGRRRGRWRWPRICSPRPRRTATRRASPLRTERSGTRCSSPANRPRPTRCWSVARPSRTAWPARLSRLTGKIRGWSAGSTAARSAP
jgi:hypothetical protein